MAINDEAQQGGQAGFTVLAGFLSIHCLQILTGDKEQNRSGTGGEPTQGSPLGTACSQIRGIFKTTPPLFSPGNLPKMLVGPFVTFNPLLPLFPLSLMSTAFWHPSPPALFHRPFLPSTVHQAEGMTPTRGVTLSLILPQSLRSRRPLFHPGGNPLPTSPSPRRQQCGIRAL